MADTAAVVAGGQYTILGAAISYANPSDVRKNVVYGNHNQYRGTLDLPSIADVKAGVVFDGGTKEGTYAGGGSMIVNPGMSGGFK